MRKDVALISIAQLRDFLGVDNDSDGIIKNERDNALDELKRATGFDWSDANAARTANELVQIMVYISYYGVRDGVKNLDYLERRRTQLMKMLQYSKEVYDDGVQQED